MGYLAMIAAILTLSALPPAFASGGSADYVWWEGESPAETNFPAQSAFSPSGFPDTRYLLSNGDWLSASGTNAAGEVFAKYRVEVPSAGTYSLWARKFWKHGPFRWRFDEGEWQTCGADVALADSVDLAPHLCVNWVFLGKVSLSGGAHVFELRLLAGTDESLTAAFDCFLLTQKPFSPNGKLKPGERSGLADEGFFPSEPGLDPFTSDALLDLRPLNETIAGESGFVHRSGSQFVLGNGSPVRFWGANVGGENAAQPRDSIDYLARRLAKLGVNMVRFHSPIFREADPTQVDAKALDNLFYLVSALKREGIYTTVSFYFPLWLNIGPGLGIASYESAESKIPFALLFFDSRLQAIYRSWARALLTTPNPYTGLPLGKDPAVAIVEIINEDSFFFWTFTKENIPPLQWQRLETLFATWLAVRYGSAESALAAWGSERLPEDDPAAGRIGLYQAWHMTRAGLAAGDAGKRKRVSDQVRFLTELQRGFYEGTVRYFRDDLGAQNLISCSNWTVSDPELLDALERYTYTAGDVIDAHGYFDAPHEGEGASYSVRVGQTFESLAGVTVPDKLPLRFVQVDGYPQTISEIGWTNPNRFRADATFLASAYGALQGIDGIDFFIVGSDFLRDASMEKFALSSPLIAGAFPAAALQYRRGDVAQADAARETLSLDDLYALKGSRLSAEASLDEFRKQDAPAGGSAAAGGLNPLTFYVGRVARGFGERSQYQPRDLSEQLKLDQGVVTSLTGELRWDYGAGLATVNTPRSQGAAGFLGKAGRVELGDVTIECDNEYASIMVVSLDDKPLATSKRILIQAITEERPYGFRTAGNTITNMGGPPLGVRKIGARITLRSAGAQLRVTALDENGYATAAPVATRATEQPGAVEITLSPTSLYHIVARG